MAGAVAPLVAALVGHATNRVTSRPLEDT